MKLFLQSLIIFFGTLMAAGLVALGEPPRGAGAAPAHTADSLAVQVVAAASQLTELARGMTR